ncbi:MAG TPA: hypothetical protein VGH20_21925 [Myxococcales bacterium]
MKTRTLVAVAACLACARGASDTATLADAGGVDASLAAAPDASVPDFTSLPLPVFLRRQSFPTNTTEEAVDGNRNVWFRRSAVPPAGEVFQDVGITNSSTVSLLVQTFAALPDPPVACTSPTNRTLIRIDAAGVTTTWPVCGSDDRASAPLYENAFLAFPPLASF